MYMLARANEKSLIEYMAVDNRLKWDVLDTKVVKGMFYSSDHFTAVAKVRMRE